MSKFSKKYGFYYFVTLVISLGMVVWLNSHFLQTDISAQNLVVYIFFLGILHSFVSSCLNVLIYQVLGVKPLYMNKEGKFVNIYSLNVLRLLLGGGVGVVFMGLLHIRTIQNSQILILFYGIASFVHMKLYLRWIKTWGLLSVADYFMEQNPKEYKMRKFLVNIIVLIIMAVGFIFLIRYYYEKELSMLYGYNSFINVMILYFWLVSPPLSAILLLFIFRQWFVVEDEMVVITWLRKKQGVSQQDDSC